MLENKVFVVMPAYNAGKTIEKTYYDLPENFRKNIILVDDCSSDDTIEVANKLGIRVVQHDKNSGYGANQKTCYREALDQGAEIVVMIHPDYQYDSRLVRVLAELIELDVCDMVLGNRIRTRGEALNGGMPRWKYFINRISTLFENFVLGQSIGDFHSGLRAYSKEVLETIPFEQNSNGFGFDQEILVQAVHFNFKIGDIPTPVRYFSEASSISILPSIKYGWVGVAAIFSRWVHILGIHKDSRFISKKVA
jgi:glycosyltransferase involved in cell wall biosynthesis